MELCVQSISSGYNKHKIIEDISFSLKNGEVLCVLGANGSGKTTLFRALMRFLPLFCGTISIDGKQVSSLPLNEFAQKVSYIPQSHIPTFSYTVLELAMMGRASHIQPFSAPGTQDRELTLQILEKLGIAHLQKKYYTQISGGERRLALIARALCQQATFIVMDEPSSDLDYANQQLVLNTIHTLKREGYGIILSTHAMEYPFSVADYALLLKDGHCLSCGPPALALNAQTLTKAFGVPMEVVEVKDSSGKLRKLCLPTT